MKRFYITLAILFLLAVTWEVASQSRMTVYDSVVRLQPMPAGNNGMLVWQNAITGELHKTNTIEGSLTFEYPGAFVFNNGGNVVGQIEANSGDNVNFSGNHWSFNDGSRDTELGINTNAHDAVTLDIVATNATAAIRVTSPHGTLLLITTNGQVQIFSNLIHNAGAANNWVGANVNSAINFSDNGSRGGIAAVENFYINIDANASGTTAKFQVRNNAAVNALSGGSLLFEVDESANAFVGNQLNVTNGLKLGSGVVLTNILSATATLDFPETSLQEILTMTVTGAATNDTVSIGVPNVSMAGGAVHYFGWVSAADTVSIMCLNNDTAGSPSNPGQGPFTAIVFKKQ